MYKGTPENCSARIGSKVLYGNNPIRCEEIKKERKKYERFLGKMKAYQQIKLSGIPRIPIRGVHNTRVELLKKGLLYVGLLYLFSNRFVNWDKL